MKTKILIKVALAALVFGFLACDFFYFPVEPAQADQVDTP